jgi:hypothetical protein
VSDLTTEQRTWAELLAAAAATDEKIAERIGATVPQIADLTAAARTSARLSLENLARTASPLGSVARLQLLHWQEGRGVVAGPKTRRRWIEMLSTDIDEDEAVHNIFEEPEGDAT